MRPESDLLNGDIAIEGRIVDASNATLFGNMGYGDDVFPIVYKPIAGERPLWDFPDGNLASREVASYLLSKAGGFHCVPTTVLREGPFGLGAVQEWVDVDESIDPITLGQSSHGGIRNLALFDVIVNNTDRKFGHILPKSESEILGCDHGVTFHEDFKLRTVIWQFAGEPLLPFERERLTGLQRWLANEGSDVLLELITQNEIDATAARIEELLTAGYPLPSEEWPAVPWPPV